ncbi:MAG: hypothetical protein JWO90_1492 [Solirubrobacterales bacterium]|nr:hypothetical protein [Solirubrobacterales bacterium]
MSAREPNDLADDDAEVVDALPVPAHEPLRQPPPPLVREPVALAPARTVPVAQAAAVAATGFAAGAVTAAVVRCVGKRRAGKAAVRRSTRHGLPIAGTRSFLVDVHLLGPKD